MGRVRWHLLTCRKGSPKGGPDGIGGKFYQVCWSIIKEDLLVAVQSFFCGNIMPMFMSHAC